MEGKIEIWGREIRSKVGIAQGKKTNKLKYQILHFHIYVVLGGVSYKNKTRLKEAFLRRKTMEMGE